MITFLDGPAQGCTLALRRSPIFLRAVRARNGRWDALDLPQDEPRPNEQVHVYLKVADHGRVHLRLSPRSASGFYANAEYRVYDRPPADEVLRDGEAWRAWAREEFEKIEGSA